MLILERHILILYDLYKNEPKNMEKLSKQIKYISDICTEGRLLLVESARKYYLVDDDISDFEFSDNS